MFLNAMALSLNAQTVDYSVVSVPEEYGVEFKKITSEDDYVCMPDVKRGRNLEWFTNRIIYPLPNGQDIAYLSFRNNSTNIFVKNLNKIGGTRQCTNRANVIDFSFSPDGKTLYFSEQRGNNNQIFMTDSKNGYACRQITSGARDFSPILIDNQVFFVRQENNGCSIWSYSHEDNFLSSYTSGLNPTVIPDNNAFIVARPSTMGRSELWKIDYINGIEECIVSDPKRSFSTPMVSPDGQYIVFVGTSKIKGNDFVYSNTDLFSCKIDGTDFKQLTYHAADDLSPAWSTDGKYLYFISQRGSVDGTANIWRMDFIKGQD